MLRSRFFCLLASIPVWVLFSCHNESRQEDPVADDSLAVEIQSDYRLVSYSRAIIKDRDADFIGDDVLSAMKESRFYKDRPQLLTKAGQAESADTLLYSEQIPFCADISESTLIFKNGCSEFHQETEFDPEINPLLSFHESEVDLTNCVARIEIKDGFSVTYNNAGEVLSREAVEMPDYTQYLAELAEAQQGAEAETKAGIKRDIHWLRDRMERQCPTKAGGTPSYAIYETEGGRIVLEQYVTGTKAGNGVTIRTFLSSDISRNYGYEQLETGILKVRCTHFFSPESLLTKSTSAPISGIADDTPSRTLVEELSYLQDGTPMIRVSDKEFRTNTIRYHVK